MNSIQTLIATYTPYNEQETKDQIVMLKYLTCFPNLLTRDNTIAHFTASTWIVNQDFTKVLMVYHNIYQSWSWCGGHVDGDSNVLRVALREAYEESGLRVQPYTEDVFAIDILPVISHTRHHAFVSAHTHLNITYLCVGDDAQTGYQKSDENTQVRWFSIEEVLSYVSEKHMLVVYQKLLSKIKMIKHV